MILSKLIKKVICYPLSVLVFLCFSRNQKECANLQIFHYACKPFPHLFSIYFHFNHFISSNALIFSYLILHKKIQLSYLFI